MIVLLHCIKVNFISLSNMAWKFNSSSKKHTHQTFKNKQKYIGLDMYYLGFQITCVYIYIYMLLYSPRFPHFIYIYIPQVPYIYIFLIFIYLLGFKISLHTYLSLIYSQVFKLPILKHIYYYILLTFSNFQYRQIQRFQSCLKNHSLFTLSRCTAW